MCACRQLGQDFRLNVGQIFSIQIIQWPDSIAAELWEQPSGAMARSELVATALLPVPERTCTSANVRLLPLQFASTQYRRHRHAGVGSGVLFDAELDLDAGASGTGALPETTKELCTSGFLLAAAAWAIDDKGLPMCPPALGSDAAGGEAGSAYGSDDCALSCPLFPVLSCPAAVFLWKT